MTGRTRRSAGALLAAFLLAGCTAFEKKTPKPCPGALALAQTATITQFRDGPGRDLVDVAWQGDIRDLRWGCRYIEQQLTADVIVDIVATRGPAGRLDAGTSLPFFVAVTRSADGSVVAKQIFDSAIEVPRGRRRGGVREEIRQVIQLAPDEEGSAYQIVVGFQLTPEQLAFNRRSR